MLDPAPLNTTPTNTSCSFSAPFKKMGGKQTWSDVGQFSFSTVDARPLVFKLLWNPLRTIQTGFRFCFGLYTSTPTHSSKHTFRSQKNHRLHPRMENIVILFFGDVFFSLSGRFGNVSMGDRGGEDLQQRATGRDWTRLSALRTRP